MGRRILVLSAGVGSGHASAAAALRASVQATAPDADVVLVEGFAVLGRLLDRILTRGFDHHLGGARASYDVAYRLVMGVPAARRAGELALYALGGRALARRIRDLDPDVVVSTYPVLTAVLGELRRRGRLAIPVCATITDLVGLAFWAHGGIDLHLLAYAESLPEVGRLAGPGRARAVRMLVAPGFDRLPGRADARRALGVSEDERLVVVSGGGWGVGDLEGAAAAARATGARVVVVCGRNAAVRERLEARYARDSGACVLGFTDRMPELLVAADALVHGTGGVTTLEARRTGCPLVAYGFPVGHVRANVEAMRRLDLLEVASDREELETVLGRVLTSERPAPVPADDRPDPGRLVLSLATAGGRA